MTEDRTLATHDLPRDDNHAKAARLVELFLGENVGGHVEWRPGVDEEWQLEVDVDWLWDTEGRAAMLRQAALTVDHLTRGSHTWVLYAGDDDDQRWKLVRWGAR